jgi:hypothetical protein
MNIFKRISEIIKMFFSGFVSGVEDNIPLERRLAHDRLSRSENLKKQMGSAEDVGAAAEMMVRQLADARIMAANLRQEAKAHIEASIAAAKRGDTVTQEQEEVRASALAEELAEAEADIVGLEQMVGDSLADKKEAIAMVIDQSKELEKLARSDSRLVGKARITSMRRQQLELRERMMDLVPGDQSNIRARMEEQVQKDTDRFRARKDVVDAMWKAKTDVRRSAAHETSAAGAAKLEELKREMGYSAAPDAAPAPAQTEAVEAPVEAAEQAASDQQAGGEA